MIALGLVLVVVGVIIAIAGSSRADATVRAIGLGVAALGGLLILIELVDDADDGNDELGAIFLAPAWILANARDRVARLRR